MARFIRKIILRTAIIVILLAVLIAVLAYSFPQQFLCVDSGKVSADVLVVLGGGFERPQRAAELFKEHAAPRIIITGKGDDEINRNILLTNDIPPGVIQVESKSETTEENALFTIKLLRAGNVHSAIIVTSWYHSRRALNTFKHCAPDITFYSRPSYFGYDRADWKSHNTLRRLRLEYLKTPGYWIRYGVSPF